MKRNILTRAKDHVLPPPQSNAALEQVKAALTPE
jgi:hypothetical protein